MEEFSHNNDISLEELFINEYSEMKRKMQKEGENYNFIINHMPPTYVSTDTYIQNYVKNLKKEELIARADGLIKAQNLEKNDYLIDHMTSKNTGNFTHFRAQWSPILWQSHERPDTTKIKIGEKIVNAGDLDFSIAQTLEAQDSGMDPVNEYHLWISMQDRGQSALETNGAEQHEIDFRNDFINFMNVRETEIKRVADLYMGCALNPASPMQELAKEKLKFILFKLSELRRLRDKMQATQSVADQKKEHNHYKNIPSLTINHYHHPEPESQYFQDINYSLGETRLNNTFINHSLNHHLVDTYSRTKPETSSTDEVNNKINTLKSNSDMFYEMIIAMRNGMTKEEWERSKQNIQNHTVNQPTVRRRQGFDLARYQEALRELTA